MTSRTEPLHIAALIILSSFLVQIGWAQSMKWAAVEQLIRLNYPDTPTITTDSLATWLADPERPAPQLLDARSPEEYAVSHLRGARRVDPEAETYPALDSLPKNMPIVVYCSVGYRSAGVVQRLRNAGFTNAVNLKGSIFRWANEGHSVYRDGQPVQEVHPYDRLWGQLLDETFHAYTPGATQQ